MLVKTFVGISFSGDTNLAKKVQGFRKRFDPKYSQHSFLHMALISPFLTDKRNITELSLTLKEEMESYFYGMSYPVTLEFNGMSTLQTRKSNIMYLNPNFDHTWKYCFDLVYDICKNFIPQNTSHRPNPKQFLPLGKFSQSEDLAPILEQVKREFDNRSSLIVSGIGLYTKKNGLWQLDTELVTFKDQSELFSSL